VLCVQFVSTFKKIRKLKNTFLFLMAYWVRDVLC
jgi:MFS-type transporter involved in bile tolerance (Atg22 family)